MAYLEHWDEWLQCALEIVTSQGVVGSDHQERIRIMGANKEYRTYRTTEIGSNLCVYIYIINVHMAFHTVGSCTAFFVKHIIPNPDSSRWLTVNAFLPNQHLVYDIDPPSTDDQASICRVMIAAAVLGCLGKHGKSVLFLHIHFGRMSFLKPHIWRWLQLRLS